MDMHRYISAVKLFKENNIRDISINIEVWDLERKMFRASWRTESHPGFNIAQILEFFCSFRNPLYGIVYRMPFKWGPTRFGLGLGTYGAPVELNRNASSFSSAWMEGEIAAGRLRDVYPMNVLSAVHLNATVDGERLEDWICIGGRGRLSPVNETVSIWEVDESELGVVRPAIESNGLLISQSRSLASG